MQSSLCQFVIRQADLVRTREAEAGYPGDGPTAAQIDALVESFLEIDESSHSIPISVLSAAFHSSLEIEMSWLFPERDPIGRALLPVLRQGQNLIASAIDEKLPGEKERLDELVNMEVIANAERRISAIRRNRPNLRLKLALFMDSFRR